jgi:hypothetical protein
MSKLKSLSKLLKKAQIIFNAYIRKRDEGLPCISCGKIKELQAGHYVPQGKSSYLRFNEWNVNGECAGCNFFDSFHLVGYRKNLIHKIGIENVEWLENNRFILHSWSREQLNFIIEKYS